MIDMTNGRLEANFEDVRLSSADITVRQLRLNDLWDALRLGYADYAAKPSALPLLFVFYGLGALLFSLLALGQDLRYLAFPVVAGFTLVGPIVAIVFFEMSRRREQGLPLSWSATLRFIHTHSFAPVLALSLLMVVLYLAWLAMAEALYFGLAGNTMMAGMDSFFDWLWSTREGALLMIYGNAVGFLFAYAAMAVSVIAFPLALDRPVTSLTAVAVSIRAFASNFWVMAVWGLIVVGLLTLGAALFLVGLAFALPVLGHATWHLYRKSIA